VHNGVQKERLLTLTTALVMSLPINSYETDPPVPSAALKMQVILATCFFMSTGTVVLYATKHAETQATASVSAGRATVVEGTPGVPANSGPAFGYVSQLVS
jgi:hypothetical protein